MSAKSSSRWFEKHCHEKLPKAVIQNALTTDTAHLTLWTAHRPFTIVISPCRSKRIHSMKKSGDLADRAENWHAHPAWDTYEGMPGERSGICVFLVLGEILASILLKMWSHKEKINNNGPCGCQYTNPGSGMFILLTAELVRMIMNRSPIRDLCFSWF